MVIDGSTYPLEEAVGLEPEVRERLDRYRRWLVDFNVRATTRYRRTFWEWLRGCRGRAWYVGDTDTNGTLVWGVDVHDNAQVRVQNLTPERLQTAITKMSDWSSRRWPYRDYPTPNSDSERLSA